MLLAGMAGLLFSFAAQRRLSVAHREGGTGGLSSVLFAPGVAL